MEQFCSKGGQTWRRKLLPGPTMEQRQRESHTDPSPTSKEGKRKVLFVFVVGGVTLPRFPPSGSSTSERVGMTVLVGSTNLTSSRKFCNELVEDRTEGATGIRLETDNAQNLIFVCFVIILSNLNNYVPYSSC